MNFRKKYYGAFLRFFRRQKIRDDDDYLKSPITCSLYSSRVHRAFMFHAKPGLEKWNVIGISSTEHYDTERSEPPIPYILDFMANKNHFHVRANRCRR